MSNSMVTADVNLANISSNQIEQWILQSYDPTNRSLQQYATQCLQQYISVPIITTTNSSIPARTVTTTIIETLFTVLSTTSNSMIQFYVLSTLQRVQYFHSLSNIQRGQLRHFLFETGIRTSTTTSPNYIRNKVAAILSTFLIQDTSIHVMTVGNGSSNSTSTSSPGSNPTCGTSTQRNWTSVTNDMLLLAQQNPQLYLQTLIYVLEDIMMSTTSSTDDDQNDNYNRVHSALISAEEIRQFKDILKGYCNESDLNHQQENDSIPNNPITLLQYLFQMIIQIYDSTFHKNISNQGGDCMDDPDGPILLLAITAIRNVFTWTTMEFLGSSQLMTQMFQLMIYTVHRYNTSSFCMRYDIMKETFACWKEFVTSCNMLPPTSSSSSTSTFHKPQPHRQHVELSSSIQSQSDPKLPIICNIIDCINATQLLPIYNNQNYSTGRASSIPNLMVMSPDSTDESSVSSDMMEVIISVAALINTIALEIIPLYEHEVMMTNSSSTPSDSILERVFQQVFDLSIRTFAYDDIDVSTEILPFIVRLSHYMVEDSGTSVNDRSSQTHISERFSHHLPVVLNILYEQMKYPTDFSYGNDESDATEDDDDEAAEELVFRTELCKVYKKLVTAAPSACLRFIEDSLLAVAMTIPRSSNEISNLNLAAASTPDIEAVLRLLYVFCEAIRPAPGLKIVMQNEAFCNILLSIHHSNIAQHPHQAVICLYYDNAVRYYPFYLLSGNGDFLSKLLNAMTSASGLQHPHPYVRSRCCFLFLKLVQVTISLLSPYVETAVTGILSLLNNPGLLLRADDTLYLFEAIGILLGKTGLETTQQQQYLRAVIAPHVRTIESALAAINQSSQSTAATMSPELDNIVEQNKLILSSSIAAITNLSKGFTKPSHEIAMLLSDTLHITLTVLQTVPSNEHIRNKSMVLVQRMILCIGEKVLVAMPLFLQCFVQWSTCDDVLFVAQIMNQLCIKFKQNAIPAIDAAVLPFLEKCQSMVPELHDNVQGGANAVLPPHLETEQLAIRKLCYIVLQHIVTHQVTGVLFTAINVVRLESMLRLMYDGVINVSDPIVKKTCLRFFRALIDQLKSIPKTAIEWNKRYEHGILVFVGENVIPNAFQFLVVSSNRSQYVSDANGVRVTAELGQLMNTFRILCGNDVEYKYLYGSSIDSLKLNFQSQSIDVHLLQEHLQQADSANDFVIIIQNAIKEFKK